MLVTPSLRALSQADPGNSLSSQPSRNSQLLVPWVTLSWRSQVKSDEGRHLIASYGLCMGTGGCSQLLTHAHAPHICTHQRKRKIYQPRMLPPGNTATACGLLMASAYSVQKPVAAVILGILLINALRCVVRSGEWRSEDRLFRSALSVCPLNAKVPCPPGSSSQQSKRVHRGAGCTVNHHQMLGAGVFFSEFIMIHCTQLKIIIFKSNH